MSDVEGALAAGEAKADAEQAQDAAVAADRALVALALRVAALEEALLLMQAEQAALLDHLFDLSEEVGEKEAEDEEKTAEETRPELPPAPTHKRESHWLSNMI